MVERMENRKYFTFNPERGYPKGKNIYYECVTCGAVIPSVPPDNVGCRCGNIFVDVDSGRVAVTDVEKMRAFRT